MSASVGLLFITHCTYHAFLTSTDLWRAWHPPCEPTYATLYCSFAAVIARVPCLRSRARWLRAARYKYNISTCSALQRTLTCARWHCGLLHRCLGDSRSPTPAACPPAELHDFFANFFSTAAPNPLPSISLSDYVPASSML